MGLAKTTPRTTVMPIASSNRSLGAFENPVTPGFRGLHQALPQRMWH
jgi:hypothetical protein